MGNHTALTRRVCAAAVLALSLAGCESVPVRQMAGALGSSGTPTSLELPPAPVDAKVWADADQEHLENRVEGFGLVHMPRMEAFLNGLLQKVRREAGVPDWPGKVYILANSGLDAYTQRSGNIYISLGYLQEAETEDELFALVAHEFSHSYLEYDALRSSVLNTDKVADVSAHLSFLGKGGKYDNMQLKGNKAMETAAAVLLAYQLGRNMLAPAWSRSQEYAADDMAVQLSIRAGYSVPDGLIRVLERQMAYEAEMEQQKKQQRDQLRQQFEQVRSQFGASLGKGEKVTSAQLSHAVLHGFLGELSFVGEDLVSSLTREHPDVTKRIARANELHERLIAGRQWPEPRSREWLRLRQDRAAQRIFESYRHAQRAHVALTMAMPDEARRFAKESRISETHGHAMPALVSWQTSSDRTSLQALQANMNSPRHRAWRSYVIYAEKMLEQGKRGEAVRVLDQGFGHFASAPKAWVEYIAMQVRLNNGTRAKELAQECARRFKGYGPACDRAADPARAQRQGPVSFAWLEKLFSR